MTLSSAPQHHSGRHQSSPPPAPRPPRPPCRPRAAAATSAPTACSTCSSSLPCSLARCVPLLPQILCKCSGCRGLPMAARRFAAGQFERHSGCMRRRPMMTISIGPQPAVGAPSVSARPGSWLTWIRVAWLLLAALPGRGSDQLGSWGPGVCLLACLLDVGASPDVDALVRIVVPPEAHGHASMAHSLVHLLLCVKFTLCASPAA